MDIFQATEKLQTCVNELQKEGFVLDVKISIKPMQKKESIKQKTLIIKS